jgi:uncharacterized protein (DUF697 family)
MFYFECDECRGTVVCDFKGKVPHFKAAAGLFAGAVAGSVVPVVGTIIGGVLGAALAAGGSALKSARGTCRDCGASYDGDNLRLLREKAIPIGKRR